jgi:hypothetical protein
MYMRVSVCLLFCSMYASVRMCMLCMCVRVCVCAYVHVYFHVHAYVHTDNYKHTRYMHACTYASTILFTLANLVMRLTTSRTLISLL